MSAHIPAMETHTAPVTTGDTISRLALARNPDTEAQTLWQLIDDQDTTVANTARGRLNLALRPVLPVRVPVIDPATGLVVQP